MRQSERELKGYKIRFEREEREERKGKEMKGKEREERKGKGLAYGDCFGAALRDCSAASVRGWMDGVDWI